jgi:hypothetical protein
VTLTVSATPSSHGGGGGFDSMTLLVLAGLAGRRLLSRLRSRSAR